MPVRSADSRAASGSPTVLQARSFYRPSMHTKTFNSSVPVGTSKSFWLEAAKGQLEQYQWGSTWTLASSCVFMQSGLCIQQQQLETELSSVSSTSFNFAELCSPGGSGLREFKKCRPSASIRTKSSSKKAAHQKISKIRKITLASTPGLSK